MRLAVLALMLTRWRCQAVGTQVEHEGCWTWCLWPSLPVAILTWPHDHAHHV